MRRSTVRINTFGTVIVMAAFVACAPREPHSEIVEKAQQAGAGDLKAASNEAIQQWLGKHREVAIQVDEMCKPIREKATAEWAGTTEGRLCSAARQTAFFRSGPVTGDGKKYLPGLK